MQPHARIQKVTRLSEVLRIASGGKDDLVWGGRNAVALTRVLIVVHLKQATKEQAGHVRIQAAKCTRRLCPSAAKGARVDAAYSLGVLLGANGRQQPPKPSALRSLSRRGEHGYDGHAAVRSGLVCVGGHVDARPSALPRGAGLERPRLARAAIYQARAATRCKSAQTQKRRRLRVACRACARAYSRHVDARSRTRSPSGKAKGGDRVHHGSTILGRHSPASGSGTVLRVCAHHAFWSSRVSGARLCAAARQANEQQRAGH